MQDYLRYTYTKAIEIAKYKAKRITLCKIFKIMKLRYWISRQVSYIAIFRFQPHLFVLSLFSYSRFTLFSYIINYKFITL